MADSACMTNGHSAASALSQEACRSRMRALSNILDRTRLMGPLSEYMFDR